MSEAIVIEPATHHSQRQARRGVFLGVASLGLSLLAAFWAVILWAVGLGTTPTDSAYGVALFVFAAAGVIGVIVFVLTVVIAVLALIRNTQIGVVCASVALAVAAGSLVVGVIVATSVGS